MYYDNNVLSYVLLLYYNKHIACNLKKPISISNLIMYLKIKYH